MSALEKVSGLCPRQKFVFPENCLSESNKIKPQQRCSCEMRSHRLAMQDCGVVVKAVLISRFAGVAVAVLDCFCVWRTLVMRPLAMYLPKPRIVG